TVRPTATTSDANTPPKNYPADTYAAQVPPEPGLYHFGDSVQTKIDIKVLLGENRKPRITKILMKNGRAIDYLWASMAKTPFKELMPVLYRRLTEGKGIEEVVLLAIEQTEERSEVEIRQSLAKQELKAESMRPFDSLEVGPHLFRVSPTK